MVQGVGFRPFVHRLAAELGLGGFVGNDAAGVVVEVEGPSANLATFRRRLLAEAPPLAAVASLESAAAKAVGERSFRIAPTEASGGERTFVPPDVAVCEDCLAELADPSDRRFRYPFINCTNCGPRFTVTRRLPYDRPNTTMSGFRMCAPCAAEYADPSDRRFHAQPIACPACGPRLWFEGPDGLREGTDAAILAAWEVLAAGGIVAIKGLGGFHLACDAASPGAVRTLRRRKQRPDKPLAVMVADIAAARELAVLSEAEAAVLSGPRRPIVLLSRRPGAAVAAEVAPSSPLLGLMLAYTPLHHLLLRPVPGTGQPPPRALVMTSGNHSGEPICHEDTDARERLGPLADAWLTHDRPIHVPCDDSVVRLRGEREVPLRRARGYAPLPVQLPFPVPAALAVGGELKNAFCVAVGGAAWMSQHLGDMGSLQSLDAFCRSRRQFEELYRITPEVVAADTHPGYQTRRWAEENASAPLTLVQHHHAHVAAAMAEHGLGRDARVIGVAFDGTGFGDDGAIWGGEILLAGYGGFTRPYHLRYVALAGGDSAVRKPYRAALAHLAAAGIEWSEDLAPVLAAAEGELGVLRRQLERGVACVPTSSMGRLFDALSSLVGIRHVVSYEAQAAIELEIAAREHLESAAEYHFEPGDDDFDAAPVVQAVVRDLRAGRDRGEIAAGFHLAVARLVAELACRLRGATGVGTVALSGGVFQNLLLAELTCAELAGLGFEVLEHRVVPPNDGGLALGQLAVAAHRFGDRKGA